MGGGGQTGPPVHQATRQTLQLTPRRQFVHFSNVCTSNCTNLVWSEDSPPTPGGPDPPAAAPHTPTVWANVLTQCKDELVIYGLA